MLRSKATWYETGERGRDYLCKLESKNFVNKTISDFLDIDGNHITIQEQILEKQRNTFKSQKRYCIQWKNVEVMNMNILRYVLYKTCCQHAMLIVMSII